MSDFILLQDLSGSFGDDLPVLQSSIVPLLDTLQEEDPNTSFGIASFVDKPISPFGSLGDYVYQVDIPLTNDTDAIVSTVNNFTVASGSDFEEAQLEALLQASLDSDLGYTEGSERFILLTTDALFHVEGDGAANSSITQPNNGDDVVDANEDYPSIGQVSSALEDNNVTPIFLVTPGNTDSYEGLVDELGRGAVVTLTSDSSNVVDAVRLSLAEVSGEVTESGTDGNDEIIGTDGDDGIFGGLGDDSLDGGLGDDVLDGGFGSDIIDGGAGADSIEGGSGSDIIDGGAGADLIEGGLDADVLTGSEEADTFAGTLSELDGDIITDFSAEDSLFIRGESFTEENLSVTFGSAILDIDLDLDGSVDGTITLEGDFSDLDFIVEPGSLEGGSGTSIRIAGTEPSEPETPSLDGDDVINGDNGDNVLFGGDGNNILYGFGGNDLLETGSGDDTLDGNNGDDTLIGGDGNNILYGFDGNDLLETGSGNDTLDAGNGNDTINSGSGNDILNGGAGADSIDSGDGNDTVDGGDSDDAILGGNGDDLLNGGNGNDVLSGDGGNDILIGGGGSDIFTINALGGNDSIRDFSLSEDMISLGDGIIFDDLSISTGEGASIINFGDLTIATVSGVSPEQLILDRFV